MRTLPVLAPLCLLLLSACGKQTAATKQDTRPPVQVNLPPVPPPEAFELIEKNAAGVWTVGGLQKHRAEQFGKSIVVEGRISEAYRCGAAEGCLPPHFTISDINRPDLTLLITGFDRAKESDLKEGSIVTVNGSLLKAVEGFTLSEEGVVADATFTAAK